MVKLQNTPKHLDLFCKTIPDVFGLFLKGKKLSHNKIIVCVIIKGKHSSGCNQREVHHVREIFLPRFPYFKGSHQPSKRM